VWKRQRAQLYQSANINLPTYLVELKCMQSQFQWIYSRRLYIVDQLLC